MRGKLLTLHTHLPYSEWCALLYPFQLSLSILTLFTIFSLLSYDYEQLDKVHILLIYLSIHKNWKRPVKTKSATT